MEDFTSFSVVARLFVVSDAVVVANVVIQQFHNVSIFAALVHVSTQSESKFLQRSWHISRRSLIQSYFFPGYIEIQVLQTWRLVLLL